MIGLTYMPWIISAILLLIGCFGVVQIVNHLVIRSYYAYRNRRLIAAVTVLMYMLVCALSGLMYFYSGFNLVVIYVVLSVVVLGLTIVFVAVCIQDRRHMRKPAVVLFLVYFLILLYLTLFMRIGTIHDSVVTTPFDDVIEAVVNRDPAMAKHMVLNVLLFLPFGYLVPKMNHRRFRGWSFAMLGGLMCSTAIEGCQMIFQIGQSDVDDIIANTIGAVTGYILVRMMWQIRKNWRL